MPNMLEPEHIAAAKALSSRRRSDAALQDYKLRGKIVWKNSSPKRFDDCLQINSTHRRKAHQMEHRFAQKYGFKGVWDAAGKVIKQMMREEELVTRNGKMHWFANTWDCFFLF